jgi:hypothetical protein
MENTVPLLLFTELLLGSGCSIVVGFAVIGKQRVYMPQYIPLTLVLGCAIVYCEDVDLVTRLSMWN